MLTLPNSWRPRAYQTPLWSALERGAKRAIAVWHRRSGKDDVALNWAAVSAHTHIGNYWHMLPEAAQARKAIWDAVSPHTGVRRIDQAFPLALRESTHNQEMMIRFRSGSTWQVVGSDNYDSLVGSTPRGVVLSEWALARPEAWAYLRPILAENGGWALFIYTSRGRNHGHTFYEAHRDDPAWHVERLRADQTGVFTAEQLAAERAEYHAEYGTGAGESLYRQEYLCEFDLPVVGAVYAAEMASLRDSGRLTEVPHDPARPVQVFADLGVTSAFWFVQISQGGQPRVIDYYESYGEDVPAYVRMLRSKPYTYPKGGVVLPHDAASRVQGVGANFVQMFERLGMSVSVGPSLPVQQGISATRTFLGRCVMDAKACARGIHALDNFRFRTDRQGLAGIGESTIHDWASHGADGIRYLALGITEPREKARMREVITRKHTSTGWMAA